MAIKRCKASIDVVKAAEIRIKNVFNNGLPVFMSFSGGKDTLCMAEITMQLIQRGEINPKQLTVQFIDEEAIFPCIEQTVRDWRKKFLMVGAAFEWFCVEVKHFNCFNSLTNDETFICWDSTVRAAESIQRLTNIASMLRAGRTMTNKHAVFPIYDWTNGDVWKFLYENHVNIPDIYLYLWQSGSSKQQLRVSQFFSVDTARSLVKMNEYYPDLMERVIRREPNAYLAALYWDSEMFGRTSRKRRRLETESDRDYKAELIEVFKNPDRYFPNEHHRYVASRYQRFFMNVSKVATNADYKMIYEGLMSGDPKLRTYRALYTRIYGKYIQEAKRKEAKRP